MGRARPGVLCRVGPRPRHRHLRQLIDQVPRARRRPEALYLLGYCLQNAGTDDRAADSFMALAFEYPGNPLVPEAWFRIGEIQFDRGDLAGAARAHEEATGLADSRFATLALYKLGWTHYRAGLFAEAAQALDRMLARPAGSAEAVALRPEAVRLRDAARARLEGGRQDRITAAPRDLSPATRLERIRQDRITSAPRELSLRLGIEAARAAVAGRPPRASRTSLAAYGRIDVAHDGGTRPALRRAFGRDQRRRRVGRGACEGDEKGVEGSVAS